MSEVLTRLHEGMPIVYGGNKVATVDAALAESFREGDRLVVVQDTGDLLHISADEWETASSAVEVAAGAFASMGTVTDDQLATFFMSFAGYLKDDASYEPIADANREDVERSSDRGRSTTRLVLSDGMRHGMIEGLRLWADRDVGRGRVVETIEHDGWTLEQLRSGLGVVGFVFEGRPNVFADATGVLAAGNSVVFRIGSGALGTARAIMTHALTPALEDAALPSGAVSLVDSPSRAAGWAMFSNPTLSLAVARGSGQAVSQLGAVARQTGTPVSLHGTGGAWLVAAESADNDTFAAAVYNSLDRKVCNTLNTVCIVDSRADDLVPVFLDALDRAGKNLDTNSKLHITRDVRSLIPPAWFDPVPISRAEALVTEPRTEEVGDDGLAMEWEWEASPEVTLTLVEDMETAIGLFNRQSPRLVASLVSEREEEHRRFFELIDAPFVGNGFTRWVDGQYATGRPELGLSNWQFGRLFGRGGVLSGDSIYTVRSRAWQTDPDVRR